MLLYNAMGLNLIIHMIYCVAHAAGLGSPVGFIPCPPR